MDIIGWDIYLEVKLLSFDNSEVKQERKQIVLEQGRGLPAKADSIFIEKARIPYGGFTQISLKVKRSSATRTILDERRKIPLAKWYSYVGSIFNSGQKAIMSIPVIGKPLEKVVLDAFQNLKVSYKISVTKEKKLTYWMGLIRTSDDITLSVFRGEFLLN